MQRRSDYRLTFRQEIRRKGEGTALVRGEVDVVAIDQNDTLKTLPPIFDLRPLSTGRFIRSGVRAQGLGSTLMSIRSEGRTSGPLLWHGGRARNKREQRRQPALRFPPKS
jgi:hypothetical protein